MQSALDTTEMTVLSWSVVLLLAQVAAQAFASYDLGPRYLLGPRDENRPRNVLAGRLARALRNLLETYPAFIAVALALVVTEKAGGIAATGAWMWLAGRVCFVVFYAFGIPVARTVAWMVALVGLLMMLYRLMV